jgi:hypothetical protein
VFNGLRLSLVPLTLPVILKAYPLAVVLHKEINPVDIPQVCPDCLGIIRELPTTPISDSIF